MSQQLLFFFVLGEDAVPHALSPTKVVLSEDGLTVVSLSSDGRTIVVVQ